MSAANRDAHAGRLVFPYIIPRHRYDAFHRIPRPLRPACPGHDPRPPPLEIFKISAPGSNGLGLQHYAFVRSEDYWLD